MPMVESCSIRSGASVAAQLQLSLVLPLVAAAPVVADDDRPGCIRHWHDVHLCRSRGVVTPMSVRLLAVRYDAFTRVLEG
ncbi:hypothetical protein ACWER6_12160 [Streptomyces sp. NPDC004009]